MNQLKTNLLKISGEVQKVVPEKIKQGDTIFGVAGTFTSDATATSNDIASGKTAYINGEKVEGILLDSATAEGLDAIMKLDTDVFGYDETADAIMLTGTFASDKIVRAGATVMAGPSGEIARTNLGITADKIIKGQSIIGAEGSCDYYEYTKDITQTSATRAFVSHITKLSDFDTSGITNLNETFRYMENLSELPSIDTSSATTMFATFQYMRSLKSLPYMDTSKVTNTNCMLAFCQTLTTLPLLDLSSVVDAWGMCGGCYGMIEIPQFDLSSATDTGCMFDDNYKLETVPVLNISSSLKMEKMFGDCTNLTDNSLNNILATLTGATAYIAQGTNMTLAHIGLTQEQATKCATLSNYEAFIAAGWTTGY